MSGKTSATKIPVKSSQWTGQEDPLEELKKKHKVRNPSTTFPLAVIIDTPTSMLQHLCSNIYAPTSMLQHLCSNIYAPTSMLQHLCSNIYAPTSMLQHLCSNIYAPTSMLQHLCSNIYAPTLYSNICAVIL